MLVLERGSIRFSLEFMIVPVTGSWPGLHEFPPTEQVLSPLRQLLVTLKI